MRRVFFLFIYFSPNEQRAVGRALPDFFFFLFFPCSADHERDWPPFKVVFSGLATNALNVRNNNNNNVAILPVVTKGLPISTQCLSTTFYRSYASSALLSYTLSTNG